MLRPLALFTLLYLFSAPATASAGLRGDSIPSREAFVRPRTALFNSAYPPILVDPIDDLERKLAAGPFTIDLSTVFADPDDRPLSFRASSSDSRIARTEIRGTLLEVVPLAPGSVNIRVTATDVRGYRKRDNFVLTVLENAPPRLASNAQLDDQELSLNQSPYRVSLRGLFVDPDEDNLLYEVGSSNPEVTEPYIDDYILFVPASEAGAAKITIVADDQNGGESSASFKVTVVHNYPENVLVAIEKPFGDPDMQTSYRMVALPGNQHTSIETVTEGAVNVDWIAYAPDPSAGGALKSYDGSGGFVFQPGRGMWFLVTSTWTLPLQHIPTVPLRPDGSYAIPLHEGWNIVSNPFERDIEWEDVAAGNSISQGLWRWQDGYVRIDTFYAALHQAEAFYFHNEEELDSLLLPHPYFSTRKGTNKTAHGPANTLDLSARIESEQTAVVTVGFGPASEEGFDVLDQFAPPGYFASLDFSIANPHPDFEGRRLAQDQRPPTGDLARFDLTVATSEAKIVHISTGDLTGFEAEAVVLVNLRDTRRYDLYQSNHAAIQMNDGTANLALLVGRREAVEEYIDGLTPTTSTLFPNYPNPFAARTTFEFTLTDPQFVNFSVFDAVGRRIVTLLDGVQDAGLHKLTWDGYDQANQHLANGVYFYRFQAGSYEETRKLVLLR